MFLQRVWTEGSLVYYGPISSHYEAVASSIVRIASGGTCLADVIAQYGCYGEFVSPLLKIMGSNVTTITVVFSVLLAVSIGSAMRFSAILIKHPLLSVGCGLCIAIAAALNLVYYTNDPVLQYFPLRFLFPAFSLLMAVWFQDTPGRLRALALGLFTGAAIAWNLESGLAVMISLGTFIIIGNFTARPWLQHADRTKALLNAVAYSLGAVVFASAFVAYLAIKSDSSINLRNYIVFQEIFSVTGFGMIPMPAPPSLWTIHALALFAILVLATLRTCARKQRDKDIELAAFTAILGAGLFVYYVGRSHPLTLRLVVWPSIIIFFFLLDRTIGSAKHGAGKICATLAVILSIAGPMTFLASAMPPVVEVIGKTRHALPKDNAAVLDDIKFIRANTVPGERVAIIAVDQGVLYGYSDTVTAIEGPGVAEMIRRVDLEYQIDGLIKRGPEKLFWARISALPPKAAYWERVLISTWTN